MTTESDTCVVCYTPIKDGWHCNQCRDGVLCFDCLGNTQDEKCPICRVDRQIHVNTLFYNAALYFLEHDIPIENEITIEEDITCIVDSSHGSAVYFCEKCNVHLCVECDKETHMYALMRFHERSVC